MGLAFSLTTLLIYIFLGLHMHMHMIPPVEDEARGTRAPRRDGLGQHLLPYIVARSTPLLDTTNIILFVRSAVSR